MLLDVELSDSTENFFMVSSAVTQYKQMSEAIIEAQKPPKKKVYRSMDKILKECYLIGSLKYGNNFIV